MHRGSIWHVGASDGRPSCDRSMKAAAAGYESRAAFIRAFKKLVGVSPAGWQDTAVGIASRELDGGGHG